MARRGLVVSGLVSMVVGVVGGHAVARAADEGASAATFEALAREAGAPVDLGTLMFPFLDECKDARRDIDKARCRASDRFLKTTIPSQVFVTIIDDPSILRLSEYDASVRGYKLMVSGCLACKQPVRVGKAGERRFVTLKEPAREGETLLASVEVARASLSFDGVDASKQWAKDVKPKLRAQFIFQPADQQWSFGPSRGFAFKMVGARVFNHCTGEVVYSKPPSSGTAERYAGKDCDERANEETSAAGGSDAPEAEAELSAKAINAGIATVRPALEACVARFPVSSVAYVNFTVQGDTGTPSSVTLKGPLEGTEAGTCVVDAARKARFAPFKKDKQAFTYPVRFQRPTDR